jgi:hypothetical protein
MSEVNDTVANERAGSAIIDILTVFDTETIRGLPGQSTDPNKPLGLAHNPAKPELAFMVVNQVYLAGNQATADLKIKARRGDYVRWRAASLSGNADQTSVFYRLTHLNGGNVLDLSELKFRTLASSVAVPKDKNPIVYDIKDQEIPYMEAPVINRGTENYSLFFYIVEYDRAQQRYTPYYYWWDPAVQVDG